MTALKPRALIDRVVDATARRPSGWAARKAYGGAEGAPKGHDDVFSRVLEAAGPLDSERVLEVGCGGGALLSRVLAQGPKRAAGLDHSPDMIALSMERNREAVAQDRLTLKLGDAAAIPWPERTFSVALSANMLFFVEAPESVLAEHLRVLEPGGRLVMATVPGPLPEPSLRNWWVAVWGSRMYVHTDEAMRELLSRAGFDEITVESTRPEGAEPLQLIRARRPL